MLELDPAKVGEALMRIGLTSCQLGHKSIYGTIDPYLLHPGHDPETQFVVDLLHKKPADVIPFEEYIAYGRNRAPFNPEGDS